MATGDQSKLSSVIVSYEDESSGLTDTDKLFLEEAPLQPDKFYRVSFLIEGHTNGTLVAEGVTNVIVSKNTILQRGSNSIDLNALFNTNGRTRITTNNGQEVCRLFFPVAYIKTDRMMCSGYCSQSTEQGVTAFVKGTSSGSTTDVHQRGFSNISYSSTSPAGVNFSTEDFTGDSSKYSNIVTCHITAVGI